MADIKIKACKLLELVPKNSVKTVVFCEVEKMSYEVFFYTFFEDGKWVQSNELVDQEQIKDNQLTEAYEQLVEEVRMSEEYSTEMRNVIFGTVNGDTTWDYQQIDKSVGLYKIKKEWKSKNGL